MVGLDGVGQDAVRYVMVGCSEVRSGKKRSALVGCGRVGLFTMCLGDVRCGPVLSGLLWHCLASYGVLWRGELG